MKHTTNAHARAFSRVSFAKVNSGLVSFLVSDFKDKQSQCSEAVKEKARERERLIGNDDVIFKLHAFRISWFSFQSVREETLK